MLKKLLGIAPQLEPDGSFSPSKLALKMSVADKTDFENIAHPKIKGKKSKVLVVFTENKNLKMKNGTSFSTGNHPVEALLPMLHLKNAGFEFEIATPTGKPVVFEMWAFPQKDEHVKAIFNEHQKGFKNPRKLHGLHRDALSTIQMRTRLYFVPGGHGAMIGIPDDKNVAKILRWAHEKDVFTITLCHGPGAFCPPPWTIKRSSTRATTWPFSLIQWTTRPPWSVICPAKWPSG